MNIKSLVPFFLLLVFACPAIAQVEINWGVPHQKPSRSGSPDILGSDGTYTYMLRFSGGFMVSPEPQLERYRNSDQKLDFAKPIKTKTSFGELDLEAIYLMGEHIVVFSSRYDRDRDKNIAYGKTLDLDGKALIEWKEITTIAATKRKNSGSFSFHAGRDSMSVLVLVKPPYEDYGDEQFSLLCFDQNLTKQWSKDLKLPYKDQFFSLDKFILLPSGDVYMLANVSKDRSVMTRSDRRTKPTYYYSILLYDRAADDLREYNVKLDPKFISDLTFEVDSVGNIICAGFYSNQSSNAIIGTFYTRINRKTKEMTTQGTMDFDSNFLEQFMSAKKVSKKRELMNYDLRHLVLREDGGAILVAEQYYDYIVCSSDSRGQMRCTHYYYYNDIIVVSIAPNGQISWTRKIPKRQSSSNDDGYFSSFSFSVMNDNMFFVFNENSKNLDEQKAATKIRPMANPRKSVAVLVTMNSRGEQVKQFMFRNRDLKIILRPKLYNQINANTVILYGERGNMYKLAAMTLLP
jgi:hypothetical protein